jgi:hypothetical protein
MSRGKTHRTRYGQIRTVRVRGGIVTLDKHNNILRSKSTR